MLTDNSAANRIPHSKKNIHTAAGYKYVVREEKQCQKQCDSLWGEKYNTKFINQFITRIRTRR